MKKTIKRQWTAEWNGETFTDSITGWSNRSAKSRTFLTNMIEEAAARGIESFDDQMRYALEQVPGDRVKAAARTRKASIHQRAQKVAREMATRNSCAANVQAFLYGHRPGAQK